MKNLVIVGAGGHGREMLQLVHDINQVAPAWNVVGFVDDAFAGEQRLGGVPLLGRTDWLAGKNVAVVVAIGSPAVRRRVVARLLEQGVHDFATLTHPAARIGARVQMGVGVCICVSSVLTTDISIGAHVIVNTASVISHDCQLADFVTLAPRVTLCGAVRVAEGAEIGASATVLQGVEVGAWSKLGGGACAMHPVGANETVVGVPGTCVRVREPGWQDLLQ